MKIGFTIGKFAPLHKGHEYLIEKALKEMNVFYIVVYDTPNLKIPMQLKIKWLKCKFPKVKLLVAYDSPKKYGLDKRSVNIQMVYLQKIIKDLPVNFFYSSEEYGSYVAKYLNLKHIMVDKKRLNIPVSASMIRKNVDKYKKYLSDDVYNDIKNIKF